MCIIHFYCGVSQQQHLLSNPPCRASSSSLPEWDRLTPHLIGLFWQDKSARQAASFTLQAELGLAAPLQDPPKSPRGEDAVADPFGKLLDAGVRAPATAALASQVSRSFR